MPMAAKSEGATGEKKKLWGGRFSEDIDPLMEKFNESLSFDRRMAQEDIRGSKGYAKALAKTGIITDDERPFVHYGERIDTTEDDR